MYFHWQEYMTRNVITPWCFYILQKAVEISERIFGGASNLLTAQAYEMLAKALLINQHFQDDDFVRHSQRAYRIALDILPTLHPKFASFKMTNGLYLLTVFNPLVFQTTDLSLYSSVYTKAMW